MAVPEYHLTMAPSDLRWFNRHRGTRQRFPAHLQVGETHWDVWVGYRGRSSRRFRKPSYDVWFQESTSFQGHGLLHLNAAYRDPSLLRNRLALSVFADLGVPTPQAWHSWLTLNGEPLGLYTALESLNHQWLERHGMAEGAIYYAIDWTANFGLIDLDTGEPKRNLAIGYEKCYPRDDDFSDLKALILGVALPDDAAFEEEVANHIDVENLLRWLVGVVFTGHTDGIVHNYALLRGSGRPWQVSPWDCDGTFGRVPGGGQYQADKMNLLGAADHYLIARLLNSPRWRTRYLQLWEECLAGPLASPPLTLKLEQIFEEIREPALRDQHKGKGDSLFLKEPDFIRRYFSERTTFLRRQLVSWQDGRNLPWAGDRHRKQRGSG